MATHIDERDHDQRIAADLRALVMSQEIPPGSRLPTIQDLAARYDVSEKTIQRALNYLKKEGLAAGRAPHGVFVADRPLRQMAVVDGTPRLERPANAGLAEGTAQRHIRNVEVVTPPYQVQQVLGDGSVVLRHQTASVDGEPVKIIWFYVPLRIAEGTELYGRDPIHEGVRVSLERLGYPLRRLVDQISARMPTEEECVTLELPENVPVARIFRAFYSEGELAVAASVTVVGGHRHELIYQANANGA